MISFSSWRCGPTFFIVLGGFFVLIALVIAAIVVDDYLQLQRYQAGRCTITMKQLIQQEVTQTNIQTINGHTSTTTTTTTEYTPDFQFTVQTADGHSYAAQGYDAGSASDRAGQQAIVDQYTVGETYPCWYDPADPSQAVLTRQFGWVGVFVLPGIFFSIGGVMVILGILLLRQGSKMNERT